MKKGEKKNQPKPPEKRDQNEEKEKPVENAAQLSAAPLSSAQHTQPVVSRRLRSAPLLSSPLLALRCAAPRGRPGAAAAALPGARPRAAFVWPRRARRAPRERRRDWLPPIMCQSRHFGGSARHRLLRKQRLGLPGS